MVFENRDTVRFQIQEMARIEKIISDEGIQAELDVYNPLIPEPGQLSATLFVELTTDDLLASVAAQAGRHRARGRAAFRWCARFTALPEEPFTTSTSPVTTSPPSVHYVRWELTPDQVEAFAGRACRAGHRPPLPIGRPRSCAPEVLAELLGDLRRLIHERTYAIGLSSAGGAPLRCGSSPADHAPDHRGNRLEGHVLA